METQNKANNDLDILNKWAKQSTMDMPLFKMQTKVQEDPYMSWTGKYVEVKAKYWLSRLFRKLFNYPKMEKEWEYKYTVKSIDNGNS